MCEFEKALQNLFLGKCQIDFPPLTNGILARLLQMSERLTVSVRARVLWENVPLWFPEQPRLFWHRCVTLHGPFPSPLLGCARRQWVLHGVILLVSWARALSPSSQYVMGGREAGGGAHVSTRPGSQPLTAYSLNKPLKILVIFHICQLPVL